MLVLNIEVGWSKGSSLESASEEERSALKREDEWVRTVVGTTQSCNGTAWHRMASEPDCSHFAGG